MLGAEYPTCRMSSGWGASEWSQFGVLAGGLAIRRAAERNCRRFMDCAGCLFTAEDVVPGVGAIAVEVVVLVIIRVEVKGAVLHFVAVVVRGVVGVAAQPGADPSTGRLFGFFSRVWGHMGS